MAIGSSRLFFFLFCALAHLTTLTVSRPNFLFHFCSDQLGQNSDKVNAIALCRGDVNLDACRSCINDSISELTQICPNQMEAIGWYDNCMLSYSNRTIFGVMKTSPVFYLWNPENVSRVDQFNQVLRTLLESLRSRAASGSSLRKFASGNATAPDFSMLYALVQCTPDLSEEECSDCLIEFTRQIPKCCDRKRGGQVVGPSCILRFETYRFYEHTADELTTPSPPPLLSPPPPPNINTTITSGKDNNTYRTVVIIVIPALTSVILIICIFFRVRKSKKEIETSEAPDEIGNFNQVLRTLLESLRSRAASGSSLRKFASGNATAPNFKMLYALVQCTPDLSKEECSDCLIELTGHIPRCCDRKQGGRVIGPSYNLRFEAYRFYAPTADDELTPPSPPPLLSPRPPPNINATITSVPSEPAFFMHSSVESDMLSSQDHNSGVTGFSQSKSEVEPFSANEVSITELYPR
ncbi:hypothetical protein JRO89_XS06G0098500 [Xanthoceras sorbifolium]|uniref:Gnk2-homologous domain-containing protein n=1 Tax=Xanthoceras sorbifolium TaxID=99658 RepID=A0ABQ8HXJ5_9ROSI|nr:hypothetical protein JRO89_XS06G0098500 [Xanthoceras sorbifolium]